MSNHIGKNGLVFLSDGRLLVPRRKSDSTISKNKVTSSIAVMLNFPEESKNNPKNAEITREYLLYGNIIKNLSKRVKIPQAAIVEAETDIEFLGFGRNIYEGGKPQFYYAVRLRNIDTPTYFALRSKFIAKQKEDGDEDVLDADRTIYAADYSSFKFSGGHLIFDAYDKKGKRTSKNVEYEMSYLCNLWHYERSQIFKSNNN